MEVSAQWICHVSSPYLVHVANSCILNNLSEFQSSCPDQLVIISWTWCSLPTNWTAISKAPLISCGHKCGKCCLADTLGTLLLFKHIPSFSQHYLRIWVNIKLLTNCTYRYCCCWTFSVCSMFPENFRLTWIWFDLDLVQPCLPLHWPEPWDLT